MGMPNSFLVRYVLLQYGFVPRRFSPAMRRSAYQAYLARLPVPAVAGQPRLIPEEH